MPHTFQSAMFCICCGAGNLALGSPLGTPFRRLFRDVSEPLRGKGRLKAGCSQDWLTHNLGGMASRIKKYAVLGRSACATSLSSTLVRNTG
jgi:hypothetical protein